MSASSTGTVTRDDIEAKLRQLRGEVDSVGERAKGGAVVAGAVAAVAILATVYLLGRRKGRKRTTVVEIRRV
jgi:cytochrome c-type biogenesis protein CcmH/NrfG